MISRTLLTSLALTLAITSINPGAIRAADPAAPPPQERVETTPTLGSSSQPALPPGNTTPTGMGSDSLPPGHPPMPGGAKALPPGHPPMPSGMGAPGSAMPGMGGGAMPPGHPPMGGAPSGMPGMGSGMPGMPGMPGEGATPLNPAPFKGSVIIKVVQGTENGPKPGGENAVIEFYSQGKLVATSKGKIDAAGTLMVSDVNLPGPVQPLITVEHGGIPFQVGARPLHADEPDAIARVTVFETTDKAPAWTVTMRHVMVMGRQADGSLQVSETIIISNPGDHAYVGSATKDPELPHISLTLAAPEQAKDIHPSKGFNPDACKLDGNRILHGRPLMPGQSRFVFFYAVPAAKDGTVNLEIAAPAATDHMMVILPDDGSAVMPKGLVTDPPMGAGDQKALLYHADQIPSGGKVSLQLGKSKRSASTNLDLDGLAQSSPPEPEEKPTETSSNTPQMVAAYGGGALVVGLVTVFLLKPKAQGSKA